MPLTIVNADITTLHVDAIVNAANEQLLMGGGVCGAIFEAAGADKLQAACNKIGHCDTGSAVVTPGFNLPVAYIIHAVGPKWMGGTSGEQELLASCYTQSLEIAFDLDCTSIAFPLISSGIYGYPRDAAYQIAVRAIESFLDGADHADMQVYLALFRSNSSLMDPHERRSLDAFIDNHLARQRLEYPKAASLPRGTADARASGFGTERRFEAGVGESPAPSAPPAPSIDESLSPSATDTLAHLLRKADAPFGETLMRMIDERGLTDAQVYRRANMSRQHFAKLRAGGNPSKRTVLALCIALGLDLHDSALLLQRAGFALNPSDKSDIIVEYFLERGGATVMDVNLALYEYDQPLLTK